MIVGLALVALATATHLVSAVGAYRTRRDRKAQSRWLLVWHVSAKIVVFVTIGLITMTLIYLLTGIPL